MSALKFPAVKRQIGLLDLVGLTTFLTTSVGADRKEIGVRDVTVAADCGGAEVTGAKICVTGAWTFPQKY
jgi:hypothetical protein